MLIKVWRNNKRKVFGNEFYFCKLINKWVNMVYVDMLWLYVI